jgi:hypothetical protein
MKVMLDDDKLRHTEVASQACLDWMSQCMTAEDNSRPLITRHT